MGHIPRNRQLFNGRNLVKVGFDAMFSNKRAKHLAFGRSPNAFLTLNFQICFAQLLEDNL
jgi:hypothetical protein